MVLRAGDVVELSREESVGSFTKLRKGTKGVVLSGPSFVSGTYKVRLDPDGKEVEVPEVALKKATAGFW